LKNIFIGGDALNGGATVVKAVANGRKVAEQIILSSKIGSDLYEKAKKNITAKELCIKKTKRIFGKDIKETSLDDRKNFNLVSNTYSDAEAKEEAKRCLFCDEICNNCVTVCPNRANVSYKINPRRYSFPESFPNGKGSEMTFIEPFDFIISQEYQIINIDEFCNECGNCSTFCPTSGAPYKDKPKFHLTKEAFDKDDKGFFIEKGSDSLTIFWKDGYEIKQLKSKNNEYEYTSELFYGIFDNDFNIKLGYFKRQYVEEQLDLIKAIQMYILLNAGKNLY